MTRLGVQFIGSVLENSARTWFDSDAGSKVGAASRSTTVNPETVEGAARHAAEADDDGDFDGPSEDDDGWDGATDDDGFGGLAESFSGLAVDDDDGWDGATDDDDGFGGLAESFNGPVDDDGGFGGATDDDTSFSGPVDDDAGFSGATDDDTSFNGPAESFSGPADKFNGPIDNDGGFGGPVDDDGGFGGATDDDDIFCGPAESFSGPADRLNGPVDDDGGFSGAVDEDNLSGLADDDGFLCIVSLIVDPIPADGDACCCAHNGFAGTADVDGCSIGGSKTRIPGCSGISNSVADQVDEFVPLSLPVSAARSLNPVLDDMVASNESESSYTWTALRTDTN